jgi:hypothetical protein
MTWNRPVTRHRPTFVLWLGPGRLPIAVCSDHYGQPIRLDRQLPCRPPISERAK